MCYLLQDALIMSDLDDCYDSMYKNNVSGLLMTNANLSTSFFVIAKMFFGCLFSVVDIFITVFGHRPGGSLFAIELSIIWV